MGKMRPPSLPSYAQDDVEIIQSNNSNESGFLLLLYVFVFIEQTLSAYYVQEKDTLPGLKLVSEILK